jgi:hypothetical protein
MAWFAGSVHGVVVQITNEISAVAVAPKRFAASAPSAAANFTSIAGDFLSSYSTSASASDEPQSRHQCTGLAPRTTWPRSMIAASARSCSAS